MSERKKINEKEILVDFNNSLIPVEVDDGYMLENENDIDSDYIDELEDEDIDEFDDLLNNEEDYEDDDEDYNIDEIENDDLEYLDSISSELDKYVLTNQDNENMLFEMNSNVIGNETNEKLFSLTKSLTISPKLNYGKLVQKFRFNTSTYKHMVYIISNKDEYYDFLGMLRKVCFSIKPNFILFNQTFKVKNASVKISNINNRKLVTKQGYTVITYRSANGKQKVYVSDVSGLIGFIFKRYTPRNKQVMNLNYNLFEIRNYIPTYIIYFDDKLETPLWMYRFLYSMYSRFMTQKYIPPMNILFYSESTKKFRVINSLDVNQNPSAFRFNLSYVMRTVQKNIDLETKKQAMISEIKGTLSKDFGVKENVAETVLTASQIHERELDKIQDTKDIKEVSYIIHKNILERATSSIGPVIEKTQQNVSRAYVSMKHIFLDTVHLDFNKMKSKLVSNSPVPISKPLESYFKDNMGNSILNHLKQSHDQSVDLLDTLMKKSISALGFEIVSRDIEDKSYKVLNEEKTVGKVVTYKIKDTKNIIHTFELFLPKVFDNGIIKINGNDYILNTQLFPTPLKAKNKSELRFQTLTTQAKFYKTAKSFSVEIAGVKIPVGILYIYFKSFDDFMKFFKVDYEIVDKGQRVNGKIYKISENKNLVIKNYNSLSENSKHIIDTTLNYISKKADKIGGELFSYEWKRNLLGTFKNFDLNTYLKPVIDNLVDPITEKYLKQVGYINDTPTTILEIAKDFGEQPDKYIVARNDIRYYRIRTYEQICNYYVNEVFTSLLTVRNNIQRFKDYTPKPIRITVAQSIAKLISGQPILRLLEYQNPLEEYVNFFKVTYNGYLGIRSENVPIDARSVPITAKGSLDPVDTPEGQNTGATQTLTNSHIVLTESGMLVTRDHKSELQGAVFGPSLSLVPFARYSEPTRLLITSNQIKQPLAIKGAVPPSLQTGYESVIAYNSSFSTRIAKKNGTVTYSGKDRIEIKYNDGEIEKIQLGDTVLKSGQGYYVKFTLQPNVKKGDKVQEGQIIAHSDYVTEDGIYKYGKNVVVAFMQYPGIYEDGIVVSEEIVEDYTSRHTQKYKLYLSPFDSLIEFKIDEIGQTIHSGEQIIKVLSNNYLEYVNSELFEGVELDYTMNGYSVVNKVEGKVTDIKIVASPSFLKNIRSDVLPKVKKFMSQSNEVVYYKQKPLDGMYIEIYVDYELPLMVGDKLVSRHANKGVVSYILEEKEMPMIEDTRERVQMIFNPSSIVDRTITALVYEIYMNMISEKLAQLVRSNSYSLEKSLQYIKVLENFDNKNTKGFYSSYVASMLSNKRTKDYVINFIKEYKMFPLIVPAFMEPSVEQIHKVLKVLDLPIERTVILSNGKKVKCLAGKLYVIKLEHLSFKKLSSRSIGAYNVFGSAVGQKDKGQKVSELDVLSMISWDVPNILQELNLDNPLAKRKLYEQIIWKNEATLQDTINSLPRELQAEYRSSVVGFRTLMEGAMLEL